MLSLRFEFVRRVPSDLVAYSPMGLIITCLQADHTLVTEEEG